MEEEGQNTRPELDKLKKERDEARAAMKKRQMDEAALKKNIESAEADLRTLSRRINEIQNKYDTLVYLPLSYYLLTAS